MSVAYDAPRHHDNRQYYEAQGATQDRYAHEDAERPRKLLRYAVAPAAGQSYRAPPSPRGPPPPQSTYNRYGQAGSSRPEYRESAIAYSSSHSTSVRPQERPPASNTLLKKDATDYRSSAQQSYIASKKPGLECTVCGPGAQGPWRRGPLGPYSLCQACSQIQWKAGDADPELPTQYEALALLDNMRAIRIVTLERRTQDSSVTALVRRLKQGLPDNTYLRAEEYFAKRIENARKTEDLKSEQRKLDAAMAEKRKREEAEFRFRQEEKRRMASEAAARDRAQKAASLSEAVVRKPDQPMVPVRGTQQISHAPASAVSPSTLEAAAALVGQRSPEDSDKPSLAGSQPSSLERGMEKLAATHADIVSSPSAASSASNRTRKFPFREPPSSSLPSKSRIIDRRRARNELLRKRYMAQKAQKAKEAAAAAAAASGKPDEDTKMEYGQQGKDGGPQATAASSTPGSAPVPPPTAAVQMTIGRAVSSEVSKKADLAEKQVKRRGSA